MGRIRDTYHAALQHEMVVPDDEDLVVGVVRKPMYGIQRHLDRNVPELAPEADLLAAFKERSDEVGHEAAWTEVDFAERYRASLDRPAARAAMDDLLAELEARDVWLVCYENTDDKRCHRTILRDVLRERR